MKNAYDDLRKEMMPGEVIEWIVFGPWGWGHEPKRGEGWELGYGEPEPPPVPFDKRGILMFIDVAKPMMEGWSFNGGHGSPDCYAVTIWTSSRIGFVVQYDGSTRLEWVPRHPKAHMPTMPGG